MKGPRSKIWAIGAIAGLGAGYGAWLFAESFLAPAGCCGATWPQPNPMQAVRLLNSADPEARNGPLQRDAALSILRARPADLAAWLRLAYADLLIHGRLTRQGQDALDASYSVAPYGGPLATPRVLFVLDNWDDVAIRTRQDATNEIDLLKTNPELAYRLRQQTPGLRNPEGRMIAILAGVMALPPPKVAPKS